jgi:glyoxylase-like metal-dependent hydrolase (beta-lactamase superfamily II)
MTAGAGDPEAIDVRHLGREHVICAWRVGDVLVDPGPASCLPALLDALGGDPVRVIALTHIHLDHAGATGALLRRFPDAEVWVHERGARHLVDPTRLLASARQLYGGLLERLWGEVAAVPAERIRSLEGGERLGAVRVAYTPGHARHHVAYLHEPSGHAFTGDVAGVRIGGGPVLPPTPPPDIDLVAWRRSLELIEAWRPARLAVTHFGGFADPDAHLGELRERLDWVEDLASRLDEEAFAAAVGELLASSADAATQAAYEQAVPASQSFQGLRRHLQRA